MNRIEVINKLLRPRKRSRYLEIGVRNGQCFLEIEANKKYAVDPNFKIPKRRIVKKYLTNLRNFGNRYFPVTSDVFFANWIYREDSKKKFDVIFIDGLHTYQQSLRDIENGLIYLKDDGFIVLHDCNPQSIVAATPANSYEEVIAMNLGGWKGIWNGEVWKSIVHVRRKYPDLFVVVLDTDFGLGIISKKHMSKDLVLPDLPDDLNKLSYQDLERNRSAYLNLKHPSFLDSLINLNSK